MISKNPNEVIAFVAQPAGRGSMCVRHRAPGPCRLCALDMQEAKRLKAVYEKVRKGQ